MSTGNKKPKLRLVAIEHRERDNPINLAFEWFSPKDKPARLKIKNGAFYLDGYPLNLDGVMRTLNTERQAAGQEQITTKPEWVV